MISTVFLKTDKFEVKLEGIRYKAVDFEPCHIMDLVLLKGKVWRHPPVVGIDIMRHPCDPRIALLLLSFGIGCVILGFRLGEELPSPVVDFLRDERIVFVGFDVHEKMGMFPFKSLAWVKHVLDVGYLASELYKDKSLVKCELAELARRVLGIRTMVGFTQQGLSSRPARIKCAMCEVFLSTVIAMALEKRRNCHRGIIESSPKKNVSSSIKRIINITALYRESLSKKMMAIKRKSSLDSPRSNPRNDEGTRSEAISSSSNMQLKSILKSPYESCSTSGSSIKRANTKGYNVSFKEELVE